MTGGELAAAAAVIVMIAVAALLAVAETSITRISTARAEALVEEGRRGARVLRRLIDQRERVLNPLLLVALGCQLGAATILAVLVDRRWGMGAVVMVFVIELIVIFVLAEALPKSWSLAHPDRSATLIAPVARVVSSIAPLRWLANGITRAFGFEAAAGEPDIVEKLKKGHKAGNKTFKVWIDGFNLIPFLKGEVQKNPRPGFMYWSDDGELMALRVNQWKVQFMEQRADGFDVWVEPFVTLRTPKIFNVRSDPFERGDKDATLFYNKWMADRVFLLIPAQAAVAQFLKTFEEFPPRQKPASFNIGEALEKARQQEKAMAKAVGGGAK